MKQSTKGEKVLKCLEDLAYGKCNDTVKLVLADDPVSWEIIDGLDLSLLSELKRGTNGVIEIKLINRLHALELLAKLTGTTVVKGVPQAENFYKALDNAAEKLGENKG